MKITDIMSKRVVAVEPDDKLSDIKIIFDQHLFHHLLVVYKKQLLGIISDRDLLKAISPNLDTRSETERDLATLNKRAHQIMTREPITLPDTAAVADAVEVFRRYRISCIPVVDSENQPVGIVSWRDLLKVM